MKKILILVFLLCLHCTSWAATYYVSPSGDDSANGTSPSTPWATVTKANTQASGGNTILFVSGGSWVGTLTPTGTVTFDRYGGTTRPIINGGGSALAFNNNSRSGVTTNNIEFDNTGYTVAEVGAFFQPVTSGTFNNCKFNLIGGGTSSLYPLQYDADSNAISGQVIQNNEITGLSGGTGLFIYANAATVSGFTILNNNIHDTGVGGIVLTSPSESSITVGAHFPYGFDINGNTFTNIGANGAIAFNIGMLSTPTQSYVRNNILTHIGTLTSPNVNAMQLEYAIGLLVYNNTINGIFTSVPDGDGIELDYPWGDSNYMSSNCVIYNNTITGATTGPTSSGIRIAQATNTIVEYNLTYGNTNGISNPNSTTTGNVFYNNTLVNNVNGGDVDGLSGSGVSTIWINNIFANNTTYGFKIANNFMAPTESYNLFFGNGAGNIYNTSTLTPVPLSITDVTTNPAFISSINYGLSSVSGARSAGTRLSNYLYLYTDIVGYSSNSAVPDIGAYFYQW